MPSSSRRSFLALAGAGAAGVGVSAAVGVRTGSDSLGVAATPAVATTVPRALTGSLVAYIDDVHGDAVSLMIGDDEVIVKDSALVARIAGAAANPTSSPAL